MRRLILSICCLLAGAVLFAQESVRVQAPDLVGVGEQFNVTVTAEGSHQPGSPEWNPGGDFQLVWGPQKVGSSTSVSIVNGKRTSTVQHTYIYILQAKNKGSFNLPPVEIEIGGNRVSSNSLRIEVAADTGSRNSRGTSQQPSQQTEESQTSGEKTADAFLRFSISKNNVYVGEPVKATLKLFARADIAGFEDTKLPTFNGFWSQETYAPRNIEFQRENVGGKIYLSAVLREYTLIPQQTGDVVIDPAEIVCVMNVRSSSSSSSGLGSIFDSFFDEYQTVRRKAVSAGYTVHVKPLPSGAPESFAGGVGNFRISARLQSDSLKTHEASSLVITLSGDGNVALVGAPKIDFPPDFDVYDVKVSENLDHGKVSGSKTFEYPFIPRTHGSFTLGPIEYSFFDYSKGRYETVSTEPLIMDVLRGKESTQSTTSGLQSLSKKDVRDLGSDIRFISVRKPDFSVKGKLFAGTLWYFLALLLLLCAGAAAFVAMRRYVNLRSDVAFTKNRGAAKMARKRLAAAGEFLSRNLYAAFYEELHKALLGFASDKLNMDVAELSKENISSAFADREVASGIIDEFTGLLDACEYARYSPDQSNDAMNAHYSSAVEVISTIDSSMKNKGRMNASKLTAALAFLLLINPLTLSAKEESVADSLWNSAVSAYSEADNAGALDAWLGIEALGLESAELYYNIGNAYYRLSQTGRAILYYERALKLKPSYADARHNLEYANASTIDRVDEIPDFFLKTWGRALTDLMSADAWAVLSLLLLALAVAAALLFFLGRASSTRKAGFCSAVVTGALAILCFACMLAQRGDYLNEDSAVVVEPVCPAKSSPAAGESADLFVIHEGTKVKVLDAVGEWKSVELADGRKGWVEADRIEII